MKHTGLSCNTNGGWQMRHTDWVQQQEKEDWNELALRHFTDKSQGTALEVKSHVNIQNHVISSGETQATDICVLYVKSLKIWIFERTTMTGTEKEKKNRNIAANDNNKLFSVRNKNSKCKFRPIAGHEGTEREQRCSCTLVLTSALDKCRSLRPRLHRYTPGEETRYLLCRSWLSVEADLDG